MVVLGRYKKLWIQNVYRSTSTSQSIIIHFECTVFEQVREHSVGWLNENCCLSGHFASSLLQFPRRRSPLLEMYLGTNLILYVYIRSQSSRSRYTNISLSLSTLLSRVKNICSVHFSYFCSFSSSFSFASLIL